MWRKVYFYSSTFRRGHVKAEKTAPEPEQPEPEPDLKTNQQDDQEPEPDSEPEDEFDPIAMLMALPKTACRTTDRFNPRLSPISEVRLECTQSEDGVSQKSCKGWVTWFTEQMLCNANASPPHSGHLEKSNSFEIKEKKQKLSLSMVCLNFRPKCGTFSRPNNEQQRVHSFPKRNNNERVTDVLSKPKHRLRNDITTAIRKLPLSTVCLDFKPKCGMFSRPNNEQRVHSFPKRNNNERITDVLSKPKRRLRNDIMTAIRILKAKYRGATKGQDKETALTWNKKKKF